MNKIIAIIQARMGSSRLPGKVLMDINGKPVLWHVVNRLSESKHINNINNITIATTEREEDKAIVRLAGDMGVNCFRGSENDVLGRIYEAVTIVRLRNRNTKITGIVRITADCPLIDPRIVDKVIEYYIEGDFDYVRNCKDYAFGLDTEVFSYSTLGRTKVEAKKAYDREHVTSYMSGHPEKFLLGTAPYNIPKGIPNTHWAVDEEKDLEFVRWVYGKLGDKFYMEDVLKLLEEGK